MSARHRSTGVRVAGGSTVVALLRHRDYRWLWSAELLSVVGDQFARVALAVLVYARTQSAAATGVSYALTFLPNVVGGAALSRLADRWRYRSVMITVDLLRAALAAIMAIPGLPLPLLLAMVVAIAAVNPLFRGAQGATLAATFTDRAILTAAFGWRQLLSQTAQVTGFALGGTLAALSPHAAMAINALTFATSAALLTRLQPRDLPATPRPTSAWREVAHHPQLRVLLTMITMVAVYIGPETLAVPYAHTLGIGPTGVGLLLACLPLGSIPGVFLALWLRQHWPQHTTRWMPAFGVAAGAPLLLFALHPNFTLSALAIATSGCAVMTCLTILMPLAQHTAPTAIRGYVGGITTSVMQVSQGLGAAALGIWANTINPANAITVGGIAGMALCLLTGLAWRHSLITRMPTSPIKAD